MDILTKILTDGLKAQVKQPSFPAPEEQLKRLKAFSSYTFKANIGDEVVRNEEGEKRYSFPKVDKGQRAIVASAFEPKMDDDGNLCDMEIACLVPVDENDFRVATFTVDSRYYKKA